MSQRQAADVNIRSAVQGPLGIIAGGGTLPCVVAEAAAARGVPLHIVGIRGEARKEIERFPHTWVTWGEVGKVFATLNQAGCRDLVIIGGVSRPDPANIKFDLGAIKNLPFLLSLSLGGDDKILSSIVRFLEKKGYRVHGAGEIVPELLAGEGRLGDKSPAAEDRTDIETAFKVVTELGRLDIGQSAVVLRGHVLAVEAAEGTDTMLERCADLRRKGRLKRRDRAGVLVKAPKPAQEERVDLPTIGPDTVRKAVAAGLAGIAVASGHVLIVDQATTIEIANREGLFLVGERWAD
jgi:DUF1009 family protein